MWKGTLVVCGLAKRWSGQHMAGFSRILTLKRVCFSMSVTSPLCFHNGHLVWGPYAEKKPKKTPHWSCRLCWLSLCSFAETLQQYKRRIIPPASAGFPNGQISLCNKAKSFMENRLPCLVLFLILPAVGLKPLLPQWEQSARGCN